MGKQKNGKKRDPALEALEQGIGRLESHWLYRYSGSSIRLCGKRELGERASVLDGGLICVNRDRMLPPEEWAYILAHQRLHLTFEHDRFYARMAEEGKAFREELKPYLWNLACRMYNAKFLAEIRFGGELAELPSYMEEIGDEEELYLLLASRELTDEEKRLAAIFDEYCFYRLPAEALQVFGRKELEEEAKAGRSTQHRGAEFTKWLARKAVYILAGEEEPRYSFNREGQTREAVQWFLSRYPLLGSLAAGFEVVEDFKACREREIQIAAVDVTRAVIWINPAAGLSAGELRFVLAHEFLHAGLLHHERRQGRDAFLWNVACDFVINGWLKEMGVGDMPDGCLYEESFANLSAESIYDILAEDLRRAMKYQTFRGYGKGDICIGDSVGGTGLKDGMDRDTFYREALAQGLEYHQNTGRGLLPAGLIEEIRALGMPPVPWDVKLAEWFDVHFPLPEQKRSYARASRRQSATPDIPRPGKTERWGKDRDRTFGVVLDTSGSMDERLLGKALGSIASYAEAKEVRFVRVVFCDAAAYDAGYLAPEEIAGKVEVTGRGGTVLQPGIDFLEDAKDFPKDGPVLIITDGLIEDRLAIHREHAFLIPRKEKLPFKPKGEVFYLA